MKPMSATSTEMTVAIASEAELVRQAQDGCRNSFDELVVQLRPRLLRFLRRWTVDEAAAEDLVQDTFTRAYENLGRYDTRWRFTTWLFTIGRRIAIDQSRRSKHRPSPINVEVAEPSDGPADRTAIAEQRSALWHIVQTQLPGAQAEALWLRYGESLDVREIAAVMGKSQVGVRVTLLRARKALAPHVQAFDDGREPHTGDTS